MTDTDVVSEPVGSEKENSGPKKFSSEWFNSPEGIEDGRQDMLYLLRGVLRDNAKELGAEWYSLERGSITSGLSLACTHLRKELIAWAERQLAS